MHPTDTLVWSMPVMTRAALESLGLNRHLTEGGIGLRLRVARVMNELIHSAANIDDLPSAARDGRGGRKQHRIKQAKGMHLTRMSTISGAESIYFEEIRPSATASVRQLLGAGDGGRVLYSYLSAIAHGTSWGLHQALGAAEQRADGLGLQAPVTLSMNDVHTAFLSLLMAHSTAFKEYTSWAGWPTGHYATAHKEARDLIADFVDRTSA